MRSLICLFILLAILGAGSSRSFSQKAARAPVLIELFTSEGCDTCPPADKYLQKLLEEQPIGGVEIIAMAEHVDYWNRLGWADPFSSALFSNRQKDYASYFKHDSVYTPQMIVNGTRELRGKDGVKPIEQAAMDQSGTIKLNIDAATDSNLTLSLRITKLPKLSIGDRAIVMLAVTEDDLESNVLRGENSGRKLKHMAVARVLKSVGEVSGDETNLSADLTLEKSWKRNDLSVVAFIQEAQSRRVLGVVRIELKS
jgi:hypothetical protein